MCAAQSCEHGMSPMYSFHSWNLITLRFCCQNKLFFSPWKCAWLGVWLMPSHLSSVCSNALHAVLVFLLKEVSVWDMNFNHPVFLYLELRVTELWLLRRNISCTTEFLLFPTWMSWFWLHRGPRLPEFVFLKTYFNSLAYSPALQKYTLICVFPWLHHEILHGLSSKVSQQSQLIPTTVDKTPNATDFAL